MLGKVNGKNNGVGYYFELEDYSLKWSSFLLCVLLFLFGLVILAQDFISPLIEITVIKLYGLLLMLSGLGGFLATKKFSKEYENRKNNLFDSTGKLNKQLLYKQRRISEMMRLNTRSIVEVQSVFNDLLKMDTFSFPMLYNGLFPAANLQAQSEYTGYSNVWVRDNIHIAHAHYVNNKPQIAIKNITTFVEYFSKYQWRLEKIVSGESDPNNSMNRPHIRFNGSDLLELNEKWSHSQNDALGYFLWLLCKLANDKTVDDKNFNHLVKEKKELMALFALYFDKIQYWQDEDNGHWEEAKKIEASSIGVVVAALIELKKWVDNNNDIEYKGKIINANFIEELLIKGKQILKQILPAECIQTDKPRPYDAALLFLIYPLDVVQDNETENQILKNVTEHLQGDNGIRRYLGDSYWSADYKEKLKPEERTIDVSDDMSSRDSLLKPGEEAQWCIFDPIMSVIYGKKYLNTKEEQYLQLQTHYFNRSLAQLTPADSPFGACKCPELYYLENGKYVPNDTTPLLWTQANLWIAFNFMEQSLKL